MQTEYQAIEIISGFLRPIRSASQPEAVAPTRRIHRVRVKTAVTAVSGTSKSCEIGTMISRKIVKSKASRVQPSHAATQASHCSLVGSFHHGMGSVVDMKEVLPVHFYVLFFGRFWFSYLTERPTTPRWWRAKD